MPLSSNQELNAHHLAMTRRKVKLAFIINDAARKATYKKRKKGLMKKVKELTTLCDIEACAILYSPYEANPEVWPHPLGVHRVLSYFRAMPAMEQGKKMLNQESFLRERIAKAHDQLKKQKKDNREMEIRQLISHVFAGLDNVENLSLDDLTDVNWVIDQRLKDIDFRVRSIRDAENEAAKKGKRVACDASEAEERDVEEMQKSVEALRIQMESEKQPLFSDMMKELPTPTVEPMAETDLMLHFADGQLWPNPSVDGDDGGSFNFTD